MAQRLLSDVLSKVTPEQAVWRGEGSTANQVAAIIVHIYAAEDRAVQGVQDKPTVFASGGWSERLGYNPDAAWTPIDRVDLDAYRAYAAEVSAATREFFSHAEPA